MELNRKNVRTILIIIAFAILLYTALQHLEVLYIAVRSIWMVFSTVIAGLCIAFVLNVLLRVIEDKLLGFMKKSPKRFVTKLCRPISIILTLFITFSIIILAVLFILPEIKETIMLLLNNIGAYIDKVVEWAEQLLVKFNIAASSLPDYEIDWAETANKIAAWFADGNNGAGIIGTATNVTTSVISGAINMVFSIIIAVYVLAQKERIGRFVRRMMKAFLNDKTNEKITRVAKLSSDVFSNFIRGQLLDCTILGILCCIGMLIFGFPYPVIISVFIAVTALVPMVGSFIGEAVGALLILMVSPIKALLFIVFILALQQIEGSFIYPKVVGKSVGLPGVIVLSAVIVGGNISGIVGAIIATPICAVIYTLIREAMARNLHKKAMVAAKEETNTQDISSTSPEEDIAQQ